MGQSGASISDVKPPTIYKNTIKVKKMVLPFLLKRAMIGVIVKRYIIALANSSGIITSKLGTTKFNPVLGLL